MADLIAKLMQELDAERPACPETQYDIGYNNGLTMAMAIARKFAKDTNVLTKADKFRAMTDECLAAHLAQVFCAGFKASTSVVIPDEFANEIEEQFLEQLQQPSEGE